jgi:S1-C subfamily serine protease
VARAGIRPGDVIVSIDGKPTRTTDDVATALAEHKPGDRVKVTIIRPDGRKVTRTVRLGESKA